MACAALAAISVCCAPRESVAAGRQAMALHARDHFEAAAALYQRAATEEPNEPRWPYLLGVVRLTLKQSDLAVDPLRQALRLQPSLPAVRLKLARALYESGNFAEAREVAAAGPPSDPEAHYWLGRAFLATGDRAGLAHLRQASASAPSFAAAHYALAIALRDSGDRAAGDDAFALYRRNPTGEPPRLEDPYLGEVSVLRQAAPLEQVRLAVEAEASGRLDDAVRFHRRALELDPDFNQSHVSLVALYGRLGERSKAEDHYRKALALNPNHAELHFQHGVIAASEKRLPEAESAFRRTLEINPHHADALVNLGQVAEWQGRDEDAEARFRDAIRTRPNFRLAHFQLGRWLVARNRHREAIGHLQAAVEGDEPNALFWFGLATAHSGAGELPAARRAAARARQLALRANQKELAAAVDRDFPVAGSAR